MKRTLVGLAMMLVSICSHAAGWSAPLTIDRTFTENSDLIVIYSVEGGVYSPGCLQNSWIFVANSDARRARAWATILTAQATGQKVQLWFTDSCTTWSYHEATSIMLHRAS